MVSKKSNSSNINPLPDEIKIEQNNKNYYDNLFNTDNRFYINIIDGRYINVDHTSNRINTDDINTRIHQNGSRPSKYISHINILTNDNNENILYSDIKSMKTKYGFGIENPIDYETFYNKIHMKFPNFKNNYIEQLYFHYILVIGNIYHINDWLFKYIDTHSMDSLETIINSPISVPIKYNGKKDVYYLYPISTYSMWNHDPKGVRVLVSFGAEICICDNFGYYPEESIRNISYFHPIPFLMDLDLETINENDNIPFYYRNQSEFTNVINEIRYIAGEDISMNWVYPI